MKPKKTKKEREKVMTYGHTPDGEGNVYFKKERKIFRGNKGASLLNLWPEPDEVTEEFWVKRADGTIEKTEPFEGEGADPTIFITKKHKLKKKGGLLYSRKGYTGGDLIRAWYFFLCLLLFVVGITFELIDYLLEK